MVLLVYIYRTKKLNCDPKNVGFWCCCPVGACVRCLDVWRPAQKVCHPYIIFNLNSRHLLTLGGCRGLTDCAICSEGYTTNMGFPCRKCLDTTSGVALAVVITIAVVLAVAVLTSYLISGVKVQGRGGGKIECLTRYIPLQSVKIVIVTWQILTQVRGEKIYLTFL